MEADETRKILPNGTTLFHGKYRIENYIKSGGFGNTYQAIDTAFDRKVAIKELFIKETCERDEDTMMVTISIAENKKKFGVLQERFKTEAKRMFKFTNNHIVKVYDLFDDNGTSYYVMDFIEGESLSEKLKRTKTPLSEMDTMLILPQILDALETVHAESIYHLDLKPANIMMDKSGNIQLIDFGASKQGDPKYGVQSISSTLTYTPGYAPAEQVDLQYDKFGPWTDIYALGATLFYLLTRKNPPLQSDIQEDTDAAFAPLNGVSQKMYDLVVWMMKPVRTMRPQNIAAIKTFLAEPTPTNPKPEKQEEKPSDDNDDTIRKKPKPGPKPEPGKPKPEPVKPGPKSESGKPGPAKPEAPQEKSDGGGASVMKKAIFGVGIVFAIFAVYGVMSISNKNAQSVEEAKEAVSMIAETTNVVNKEIVVTSGPENLRKYSYSGPVSTKSNLPMGKGSARFYPYGEIPGGTYDGNFGNGLFDDSSGQAIMKFDNGDMYIGKFAFGFYTEGRYILNSKEYFKGTFKNGTPYSGTWYSASDKPLSKVVDGKDKAL